MVPARSLDIPLRTPTPSPSSGINGVYALGSPNSSSFSSAILSNPSVDGLALRENWDFIESTKGTFNWSHVDAAIALAASHGKKVSISVAAGIHTPTWLYGEGVQPFSYIWDQNFGPPICSTVRIPVPWDETYLTEWEGFLQQFAARYATNPTVALVKVSGINGNTAETFLPHSVNASIKGQCQSLNDVQDWVAAGYTRLKVETANARIVDAFNADFPNLEFSEMFVRCGFPAIDDNGAIVPNQTCENQATLDMLGYGIGTHGNGRYVAQNDGLTSAFIWQTIVSAASSVGTGYQEARPLGSGFPAAASAAVNDRAKFIEVYSADLLNPALQGAITAAHDGLLKN